MTVQKGGWDYFDEAGVLGSDGLGAIKIVSEIKQLDNIFVGGENIAAGTSNNLFQLWNPSGSGVDLIVQSLSIRAGGVANIDFWNASAALTTKFTDFIGNLDFSGSAPSGELYLDTDATETGTRILQMSIASANIDVPIYELIGCKITEGTGLTIRNTAANILAPRIKWQEASNS